VPLLTPYLGSWQIIIRMASGEPNPSASHSMIQWRRFLRDHDLGGAGKPIPQAVAIPDVGHFRDRLCAVHSHRPVTYP